MSLEQQLKAAITTTRERGRIYGPNHDGFKKNGAALAALFPDGLTLKGVEDFSRFLLFNMSFLKQCRYANNIKNGGHKDSIHDSAIYAFILEGYDDDCRNGRRARPGRKVSRSRKHSRLRNAKRKMGNKKRD